MTQPILDRFRFLAATGPRERTPVLAEAPAQRRDGRTAVLRLYDPIDSWGDFWGVSAKEWAAALDEVGDVDEIRVHINSPGGEVFEGIAILNQLRAHPARVVAVVDGVAASSASFIAAGADETIMAPNSELMIHDAWGAVVGNAADLRDVADRLDQISGNIATVYHRKAGGELDAWREAMRAEAWYTAEEAVAAGLADQVAEQEPADADAVRARFDLSVFAHAGRRNAPPPPMPRTSAQVPAASAAGSSTQEADMPFIDDVRQRVGADESADEATILAALDEALAERAEAPATTTQPEGTILVDAGAFEELRAQARQGVEARAEQIRAHREQVVDAAVADGRIAPARRQAWLDSLAADPGAEATLVALPKGLVPLAEVGSEAAPEVGVDGDALLASLFGSPSA